MRPPRPLTTGQARRNLAERLAPIADRVRQRTAVAMGIRPYRVFLVWAQSGLSSLSERGDGSARILARVEILPAPRVTDLTGILRRSWSVGTVPEGSVRVDRITTTFTDDVLRGIRIPALVGPGTQARPRVDQPGPGGDEEFSQRTDFFYEIVEDGRGDDPPIRRRFRLLADPTREPGSAQWVVALERADRDMGRDGSPPESGFPALP